MPNLTSIGLTAGVPTSGTGTVGTLDNVTGTAGSPSTAVLTVQGVASGTAQPVSGTVTASQGTAANLNATVVGTGTFAVQSASTLAAETTKVIGTVRTADGSGNLLTSTSNALDVNIKSGVNANGRATPANSAPVVLNSMTYVTAAASTTQQCGATGASGDYLDGVLIIPGTAAAGVVQIKDGSGSAINIFAGGVTTALPTLAPFYVPIGAISSGGTGGWKVITNANVTAIAVGNFT